jgi:hypothetical protein
VAASVGNVFVVGAPELAKRGGRLHGEAAKEAESGVAVLALRAGAMDVVAHARDVEGAVGAMAAVVEVAAVTTRLRVGVGDAAAAELAVALADRLDNVQELVRYEVGPSVTAHTGRGTAGAVFFPADLTSG